MKFKTKYVKETNLFLIFSFLLNFSINNSDNKILNFIPAKQEHFELSIEFLQNLNDLFKPDIFFETGTFLGHTTSHASECFKQVFSVELSKELFENAKSRFADQKNIKLFNGDSAKIISQILPEIKDKKVLFWLDAHWSGGQTVKGDCNTAVICELNAIKKIGLKNAIILIDDVRFFQPGDIQEKLKKDEPTAGEYPSIPELLKSVYDINPEYKVLIYGDILIAFIEIYGEVSKFVNAMTVSKFYDEFENNNISDLKAVLDCEKYIAFNSSDQEINGLIWLVQNYSRQALLGKNYLFWYALALYGKRKFNDALKIFQNLKELNFGSWRINYYISQCLNNI